MGLQDSESAGAAVEHFVTFRLTAKRQIILRIILKLHLLPRLPSANAKDSPPEARLQFFIIIQPKLFGINGGQFSE